MPSRWTDLDRPPLSARALAAGLTGDGALWRDVRVVERTGSTNDDVAAAAREGVPEGLVLVAESQVSGHGRLGRSWVSPPRAGLTFSALLRPGDAVPPSRWSWLPLLAGLALHRAVVRLAAVDAWLKWPNDLLLGADRRKAAGLLLRADAGAAVVGIGLNVSTSPAELPTPAATSLAVEGADCTDRDPLLRGVLRQLGEDYLSWRSVGGDPDASGLRAGYTAVCDTVGRQVRVALPRGGELAGLAVGVDDDGGLLVRDAAGERSVTAGDVVSVR